MADARPTRRVRAPSVASTYSYASIPDDETAASKNTAASKRLPMYHLLPPTVPCPFPGTLNAALDALLEFGKLFEGGEVRNVVERLLAVERAKRTDWADVYGGMLAMGMHGIEDGNEEDGEGANQIEGTRPGKELVKLVYALIARTLLPNAVLENRGYLVDLYTSKRNTHVKFLLRYDMLFPTHKAHGGSLVVPSPSNASSITTLPGPPINPLRPALLPNIWPTLLVPPEEGFATKGIAEKMRHHVTGLDAYLVVGDAELDAWGDTELLVRVAAVTEFWVWVREANERLDDFWVAGWEGLGESGESGWFLEAPKEREGRGGG